MSNTDSTLSLAFMAGLVSLALIGYGIGQLSFEDAVVVYLSIITFEVATEYR